MSRQYFMGMSTGKGYDTEFYIEHESFYGYYIKGGPGTGKSTLIKKLSDAFPDENKSFYYCSSDPKSFDAVVFEDKKFFIADATAPHEGNVKLPFVTGEIIDLASSLEQDKLTDAKDKIIYLNEQNQACHSLVKKYLSEICVLQKRLISVGKEKIKKTELEKFVKELTNSNLKETDCKNPTVSYKQRISNTPHGKACKTENARLIIFKDELLYASLYIVAEFIKFAVSMGYSVEITKSATIESCKNSLVFIPELNLMLCAEQNLFENDAEVTDLKDLYCDDFSEELKAFVSFTQNSISQAEENIKNTLSKALQIHDELEKFYIDAIDKHNLDKKFNELRRKISKRHF